MQSGTKGGQNTFSARQADHNGTGPSGKIVYFIIYLTDMIIKIIEIIEILNLTISITNRRGRSK